MKQVKIAEWNFDNESQTASGGIESNLHQNVSLVGANLAGYVLGFGSGSRALNSNGWNTSEESYWLIQFTTTGYESLTLSSRQYGSNTGPRDFKVQFSLNGTTWTDVANTAITVGYNWGSGYLHETVLPEETNHQKLVYIRWLKTSDTSIGGDSSLGTTGSNRIDDIVVYGFPCKCEDVQDKVADKVNELHEAEEEPSESIIDDHEKDQGKKNPPETDEHASSDQEEAQQKPTAAPETEHSPVPEDIQAGSDVDCQTQQPETSSPVPNDQTDGNEEAQTEIGFGEHTTEADYSHLPSKQGNDTKKNQIQPDSDEHIANNDSKPSTADEQAADTKENQPDFGENSTGVKTNSPLGNEQPTGIGENQAKFNADKHLTGNGLKPPATDERMAHPEKTQGGDRTRNKLYSPREYKTTVPDTSLSMDKKPAVYRETASPASGETLRRKTNEILSKDLNLAEQHSGTSLSVKTPAVINDPNILKEKQAEEKQNNTPTKTDSPLDLEPQKENIIKKRSKMKNEITFLNAPFLFGFICLIGGSALLFFWRRKKMLKNES
ncbi:hypothetical protein MOA99_01700 [Bacillus haynesii]|uniref:hypothetical protein n=1 Tax=Bacillus haynesii TaxID=1925021 RepID=UPI00228068D8|nr:hypothetical protein [Bacillus haynesii]MCY7847372.1 hypothetical protein [Bacillus haynesii]MCY8536353.1 hypothetical protein [Bacillus haynesii]MEC0634972.1 hypothetical protein [Bacillus haynesii]